MRIVAKTGLWNRKGKRYAAEIEFTSDDNALFDTPLALSVEVREWLDEAAGGRHVILASNEFLRPPRLLFSDMMDAIHFKLRWS